MVFEFVLALLSLLGGIILMIYCSGKAVKHSVNIASKLKVSPLFIGLVIVSLGTDLPEIFNSVISWSIGHGDIAVGDSFGSILSQITLVLGLVVILYRKEFNVKKEEIVVVGACLLLSLIAAISIVEKGYISRTNGLFLVVSWPILMLIIKNVPRKTSENVDTDRKLFKHIFVSVLSYIGIAVGSYVLINSVITIASHLNFSEYLISFFIVAIGTSLPELVVGLTALRRKQYELAIGDVIGSCIVDASLAVGIGPLFFPGVVSGIIAETTGLYALFASFCVLFILALRGRLDRKAGIFFIILYGLSYLMLLI